MKRIGLYLGMAGMLFAAPAVAQTDVDTFETYADQAALDAKWTTPNNAGQDVLLESSGGANGSTKYLKLLDGGFGFDATGDQLVTPAAGNYKLSFYYQNGLAQTPLSNLQVFLDQAGGNVATIDLLGTAVATWTPVESSIIALDGSAVSITVKASSPAGSFEAAFDEFILTPVLNAPLTVEATPDDVIYLSNTRTITAIPDFGSGTYSKVDFDVGNDGVGIVSDNTAPFEFSWDTTVDLPNTSGTIDLKIEVTDDASATASIVESYFIDNEYGGRDSMVVNGDFSAFQDGTNFGANAPVGWTTQLVSPNATYGPSPDSHSPAAGQCLLVTFTGPNNLDNSDRYTLRTDAKTGNYRDMQAVWWGKGGFCRLYYFISTDDGATFATTSQTAGTANDANWVPVVEDPVQNGIGLTDTTQVSLATHTLGISSGQRDAYWDDLTWEGNLIPAAATVESWNLY